MKAFLSRLVIAFVAWLAGQAGPATAIDYDVYILTGQSNSLGTTAAGDTLTSPGTSAADASTAFFWSNVSASNTAYPPTLYGDSAGGLTALGVQQGDGGSNPTFWGLEFGFARTLASLGGTHPLIIKASRGGGSNTLWSRAAFDVSDDAGHMWGHLRDTIDAALTAIAAGDSFQVRGLLFMQGESNTAGDAPLAGDRLASLAADVVAHVEQAYPGRATGMKTVAAEIAASDSTASRITTTSAQRSLAATAASVAFVATSDLPLKTDGIHFGGVAKLEIGRRMANAMTGRGLEATSFDAVAGSAGSRSLVFDLAVPDANGATNGAIATFPGGYGGFVSGTTVQAAAGVFVEGSSGSVVFADYYGTLTSSDLAAGGQPATATSGQALTFTFVDPSTGVPAVVAGVGFELRAATGDGVTATFLDQDGVILHQSGALADGRYGYESFDSFLGTRRSLIHQVLLSGSAGTLWTVGHPGDAVTADFAYSGLVPVPEPSSATLACGMMAAAAGAGVLHRQRRFAFKERGVRPSRHGQAHHSPPKDYDASTPLSGP